MFETSIFKKIFRNIRRKLAKIWLDINLQLTIIGITGSYGKTSTVRAIAAVLSAKYSVNQSDLNLDTIYNLPITILKTKIWNEILVLEYGVDQRNEMDFHLSLVRPKIAVLTGISPVHSDEEHLGSLKNLIDEKRKLIDALPKEGLAIFNYDDDEVRKIGGEFKGRKYFYGTQKGADFVASNIKISTRGTEFEIQKREDKGNGSNKVLIKTGILGYPAVYCSLVAYIIGRELKVDEEKIIQKLKALDPLWGRFSLEPGPLGTILLNDAKRANPASTIAGLKSLSEFPGRKIVVMGEMGELGDLKEKMHLMVGTEAAKLKIDVLMGVGPLTKYVLQAAAKGGMKKSQLFWAKDVIEAAEILKKVLKKDDFLYLKASLLRHLERIILLLEGEKIDCRDISCHHYESCPTCGCLGASSKIDPA